MKCAERDLAELGAHRYRAEAVRELRRLGRRVRRPSAAETTASALSGREREVALLVARGHSNRQIATRPAVQRPVRRSPAERVLKIVG